MDETAKAWARRRDGFKILADFEATERRAMTLEDRVREIALIQRLARICQFDRPEDEDLRSRWIHIKKVYAERI